MAGDNGYSSFHVVTSLGPQMIAGPLVAITSKLYRQFRTFSLVMSTEEDGLLDLLPSHSFTACLISLR